MIRTIFQVSREEFTDEEILHVCGALYINAHEVPINTSIQAIYQNASFIEHNCINNASKHFDSCNNIQIRAAVHIQKGDHISITYTDPMWGTSNRQMHLKETKFFQCICKRCKDPSEMGTYFSALKCPSCPIQQQGYLLSHNPLKEGSLWICTNCEASEMPEYVTAVIRSIGEELIKLEKSNATACKSFLKKHSQNLHYNHFYLMDVKLALCQMIGDTTDGNDVPEKDLIMKQKLCLELVNVANIISPGISRLRGVILYELQKTLSLYSKNKYTKGEITLDHLVNILQVRFHEIKWHKKPSDVIFMLQKKSFQKS